VPWPHAAPTVPHAHDCSSLQLPPQQSVSSRQDWPAATQAHRPALHLPDAHCEESLHAA
jgi:hypothetical protein